MTMDDRIEIERLLDLGFNTAEIARRVGVHRATITRETARGRGSLNLITRTCVRTCEQVGYSRSARSAVSGPSGAVARRHPQAAFASALSDGA
ncbi:helix-turn-helix domain-containing protein [Gryllotalpicola sp.]|uniref:helix-turn-helix domain-containing protein n=1 Tax=Gryllotalpicola sp. TaxID=1932787 RepID=UPI00342E9D1C